jgi:type IV pilus modification protein PilV
MDMEPNLKIMRKINRLNSSQPSDQSGFSLIEVMISMGVLTVGLLAFLSVLCVAVSANQTSQQDMIARQLASEAMESIFNARNTSQIGFSEINNTTATPPGIFLANSQPILCAGADGILDTADDASCTTAAGAPCPNSGVECLTEPGPDGIMGTADDVILSLSNYTRTVLITPLVSGGSTIPTLVQVTITINYNAPQPRSYVLEEYISEYH